MTDRFPAVPWSAATDPGKTVEVALVQSSYTTARADLDPRDANLEKALDAIGECARGGAKIVVFGEMYLQGPRCGPLAARYATTPTEQDPHVAELAKSARELGVSILMGCITRDPFFPGDLRNSALVVTAGTGVAGIYHKAHLADFPYPAGVSCESAFYSRGCDLRPQRTSVAVVGLHICYDIFFPEVARAQALAGAELLVNVAAEGVGFEGYWSHLTWARAVENASWYLMCTVADRDPVYGALGESRVVAPDGELVAKAARGEEEILRVTVDLERSRKLRSQVHLFQSRQPEAYRAICSLGPPDVLPRQDGCVAVREPAHSG